MPLGVTFRSMSAASPLAAWKKIASQSLGVAASSISFTGIDTTYKMFRVTAYLIKDATPEQALLRINNDSGANYTRQYLFGNDVTVSGGRSSSTSIVLTAGLISAGEALTMQITIGKQLAASPAMLIATEAYITSGNILSQQNAGIWNNNADLISRIDLIAGAGNFDTGSVVVLEAV